MSRIASIVPAGKDKEPQPAPLALLIAFVASPEEAVQVPTQPSAQTRLLRSRASLALLPFPPTAPSCSSSKRESTPSPFSSLLFSRALSAHR